MLSRKAGRCLLQGGGEEVTRGNVEICTSEVSLRLSPQSSPFVLLELKQKINEFLNSHHDILRVRAYRLGSEQREMQEARQRKMKDNSRKVSFKLS